MPKPQRSLPPASGMPPLRLWPRLAGLSLRAVAELVRGRYVLTGITVPEIQQRNAASALSARQMKGDSDTTLAWIAYTIPRVAQRMPFRSDCLVQALAGQNWLAARQIASEIVIGADFPEGSSFAAHAWLRSGGTVVTGGDISSYTVLV